MRQLHVHAPFVSPARHVGGGRGSVFHEKLGHVKSDAAGTDHGDSRADRRMARQNIQVAQNASVVAAWKTHRARRDACGDHHLVVAAGDQRHCVRGLAELHVDAVVGQLMTEVAQGFIKLFLAWYLLGVIELAADFLRLVDQRHGMAALAQRAGAGQARGTCANDGNALALRGGCNDQLGLVAGARVDQATSAFALKDVIETGLIAGDAGIDAVAASCLGLYRPLGVGQQRPRHRDHIGSAVGKNAFGHVGHVDAVRGDQRDRDLALELLGDPGEACTRHAGDDGWYARLMPADAGIDDAGARRFDALG